MIRADHRADRALRRPEAPVQGSGERAGHRTKCLVRDEISNGRPRAPRTFGAMARPGAERRLWTDLPPALTAVVTVGRARPAQTRHLIPASPLAPVVDHPRAADFSAFTSASSSMMRTSFGLSMNWLCSAFPSIFTRWPIMMP